MLSRLAMLAEYSFKALICQGCSLEEVDAGAGVVETLLVVGHLTLEGVMLTPAQKSQSVWGPEGQVLTAPALQ